MGSLYIIGREPIRYRPEQGLLAMTVIDGREPALYTELRHNEARDLIRQYKGHDIVLEVPYDIKFCLNV